MKETSLEELTYFDLIELIEKHGDIIRKQAKTIAKLINENAEKENMIKVLMQEHIQLSE